MTRATQQLSIIAVLSAIYVTLLLDIVPILPDIVRIEILPVIPFWVLVTFGAYLLSKVGMALLFFNDVPQAYETLQKEIELAKTDLRKRGVEVD